MSLREDQIKAVDELIKSASDYVTNGHLLNREQIVFLCNREVEKRIDKEIQSLYKPSIRNNPMVIQKRDFLREFKKEMLLK